MYLPTSTIALFPLFLAAAAQFDCDTPPLQCCTIAQDSDKDPAKGLVEKVGVTIIGGPVLVGINCDPITVSEHRTTGNGLMQI
jgi:hypothetical protein